MALPIVHVPAGAILRLPNGQTVQLKAGEHYNAPAGTMIPEGPVGVAPTTITTETTVEATPAAGQEAPGITSTGTPAGPPQPATPTPPKAKAKVWNETPAGAHLNSAYDSMRNTFAVNMSKQREQIQTLARRHIGG